MNKTESGSVNKMGTKWPNKKHSGQRNNVQQEEKDWTKNCKLCGYEKHAADRCPARDRRCLACNEIGHFSKHCSKKKDKSSTKKVTKAERESDTDTDDDSDCKKVVVFSVNNKTTLMKIKMNGNDTQWQPDTGSNKNLMDMNHLKDYEVKYGCVIELQDTRVKLFPYGFDEQLTVMGKFKAKFRAG